MASVTTPAVPNETFTYTYLGASSQVAGIAMPGSVTTVKSYDSLGRLDTVTNSVPGQAPASTVSSFDYTYDSHNTTWVEFDSSDLGSSFDGLTSDTEFRIYATSVSGGDFSKNHRLDHVTVNGELPEPATLAVLGLGGVGLLLRRRRRT
jgi:hypothetical protein